MSEEHNNGLPIDARTRAIIDRLPADEQARLQDLMARAAGRQRRMLEAALEDAVGMVPAPLRRRVQKLFRG